MRFQGQLYRALNPVYAREPLFGRGAGLHGGRFNRRGMPALYAALTVQTAIREANQAGTLQPTTLVAYEADVDDVFDSQDGDELRRYGMSASALADPTWRDQMRTQGKSRTQSFAEALVAEGFNGLLVRSYAPGASQDDLNIVLWRWGDARPAQLTLIDDEGRLG